MARQFHPLFFLTGVTTVLGISAVDWQQKQFRSLLNSKKIFRLYFRSSLMTMASSLTEKLFTSVAEALLTAKVPFRATAWRSVLAESSLCYFHLKIKNAHHRSNRRSTTRLSIGLNIVYSLLFVYTSVALLHNVLYLQGKLRLFMNL